MPDDTAVFSLPPSGPWSGYYLYPHNDTKHRMHMNLTFTKDGKIDGDGIDDVALFKIRGLFYRETNQATWTKSYLGMHGVAYCGLYDGRSICGNWTIGRYSGGFWIWPKALSKGEWEAVSVEIEEPDVIESPA